MCRSLKSYRTLRNWTLDIHRVKTHPVPETRTEEDEHGEDDVLTRRGTRGMSLSSSCRTSVMDVE